MRLRLTLLILTSITAPLCESTTVNYSPSFDRSSPVASWPPVTLTVGDMPLGGNSGVPAPTPVPTISISVRIASEIRVQNNLYHAVRTIFKTPCDVSSSGDVSCGGMYIGKFGEYASRENLMRVKDHLLRSKRLYFSNINQSRMEKDSCVASLTYQQPNRKGAEYQMTKPMCTLQSSLPDPVSCNVTGPANLNHPTQPADSVSSIVEDKWRIRCTAPVTVNVSTTRAVNLSSGANTMQSGLYVGRAGVTGSVIDVEGIADVNIVSQLETPSAPPGQYSGSGIITIDWY